MIAAAESTSWELASTEISQLAQPDLFRMRIAEPERRLLLAVLVDAIVCLQRRAALPPGPRRAQLDESERWVRSNSRSWPISFVNVCEGLGLAHEPLRRALLASQPAGFNKREVTVRAVRSEGTVAPAAQRGSK
jgi:hypothetical protein